MPRGMKPIPVEKRFWNKVLKHPDGCWEWVGWVDNQGYGCVWRDGGRSNAHRVSWNLHFGDIPDKMFVCHKCDNRLCVRPDHLFLGTYLDNIRDRTRKGRSARGSNHGRSKLTEEQVREILRSDEPLHILATRYAVSRSCISAIKSGVTWRHVAWL
jgi:hypothetical protein